ncbi:MAG: hypothetical protein JXQ26_03710 [Tissierellales bacterium]|jgi:hypothetical protein|nr:hypothetical protein [Tissierellales bacterium]MBN2827067.1 hypothetical protein [Tissierellales bacterium]
MKKEMLKKEEMATNKFNFKSCGTITCIHNINNKCLLKKCEMHERSFRQEGI